MAETCGNCRYWEESDSADSSGTCLRHTPSSRLLLPCFDAFLIPTVWPITQKKNWCGEWRCLEDKEKIARAKDGDWVAVEGPE